MRLFHLQLGILWVLTVFCIDVIHAQNIHPRPTILDAGDAERPRVPTPLRRFDVPMVRVEGMRLEAHTRHYAVFSDATGFTANRRLFVWDDINRELRDTQEIAVPNSLRIAEDEKYIIYLVNEAQSGEDINGDGTLSTGVLRLYHLATGQRINLGVPARSATPIPTLQSQSQFEFFLNQNSLIFSTSTTAQNNNRESDAPWTIVDLELILFQIEGTPTPTSTHTPTPTPTPVFTATRTPTPSATATNTPPQPVPPGFIKSADINSDGSVNQLDLMILREFWFVEPTPTPFIDAEEE